MVVIPRHPVRPLAGRMTGSGGVSSTPRLLGSIAGSSEYWIARSSRAMTVGVSRVRRNKLPASTFKQPDNVIARSAATKQSSFLGFRRKLDCFASLRNDGDTTPRSRGLISPRFAGKLLTLEKEGAGNAGRAMRPQPGGQKRVGGHTSSRHHGHTGITRHSPRNGLQLTSRSPR
jgi:hypothetical protein